MPINRVVRDRVIPPSLSEGCTYPVPIIPCEEGCSLICSSEQILDLVDCLCLPYPPPPPAPDSPVSSTQIQRTENDPEPVAPCYTGYGTGRYRLTVDIRGTTTRRCVWPGSISDTSNTRERKDFSIGFDGPFYDLRGCDRGFQNGVPLYHDPVLISGSGADPVGYANVRILSCCNSSCSVFVDERTNWTFSNIRIERLTASGSIDTANPSDCFDPPLEIPDCEGNLRPLTGTWEIVVKLTARPRFQFFGVKPVFYRTIEIPGTRGNPPSVEFDLNSTPPKWGVTFQDGQTVILNFPVSGFNFYEPSLLRATFRPSLR
jgi:hypothetical protein